MVTSLEQRHMPRQEMVDTINDMIASLKDGSQYPFQSNIEEDDGVSEYKVSIDGDNYGWDFNTQEELEKEKEYRKHFFQYF